MKEPQAAGFVLKGTLVWWRVGGQGEPLAVRLSALCLAVHCWRKNGLSWLPVFIILSIVSCYVWTKLWSDLFFLYEHWWAEGDVFYCSSLAVFGKLQEGEAEENKIFSQCTVFGWCKLMQIFLNEMFRRDHTTKAEMKMLFLWYVLGVLWTYCYIANISKYRHNLYIVFHKA